MSSTVDEVWKYPRLRLLVRSALALELAEMGLVESADMILRDDLAEHRMTQDPED